LTAIVMRSLLLTSEDAAHRGPRVHCGASSIIVVRSIKRYVRTSCNAVINEHRPTDQKQFIRGPDLARGPWVWHICFKGAGTVCGLHFECGQRSVC